MRIIRILNNSAVVAVNEQNLECVVLEKGIAFTKKVNDDIEISEDTKVFLLKSKSIANKFTEIVEQTPAEFIRTCDEIINRAKLRLPGNPDDSIYIALTDHLVFAARRHSENAPLKTDFLWEIKTFYPEEFNIGLDALEIIHKRLGIHLDENEASYIALHIINAWSSKYHSSDNISSVLTFIQDILDVIRLHLNLALEERTLELDRFVTHLKYFAYRMYGNTPSIPERIDALNDLSIQYPIAAACALKVRKMLIEKYQYHLGEAEQCYILIYIERMRVGAKSD